MTLLNNLSNIRVGSTARITPRRNVLSIPYQNICVYYYQQLIAYHESMTDITKNSSCPSLEYSGA